MTSPEAGTSATASSSVPSSAGAGARGPAGPGATVPPAPPAGAEAAASPPATAATTSPASPAPPADAQAATSPGGRSRWQRIADVIEMPENPETQIYGTITAGALLAAEADRHETFWQVGGSVALALIVVWFAHAYATGVAARMHSGEGRAVYNLMRGMLHELALLRGAFVPLFVLLFAGVCGANLVTAETAALVSAALLLVVLELLVGLRSSLRPTELAVQVAVSALIGVSVLVLRIIVH